MFFTFCGHFDFGVVHVFYTGVGTHALPRGMQMAQTLRFVNPWVQLHDDEILLSFTYPLHFWGAIPINWCYNSSRYCAWLKNAHWNNQLCIAHFRAPKFKASRKLDLLCTVHFWSLCNLWGRNFVEFPGWSSKFQAVHFPSSQKLAGRHRSASNFPGRRATSVSATERNAEWMQICKLSNIKHKAGKLKWLVASNGDLFGKLMSSTLDSAPEFARHFGKPTEY